MNTIRSKVGSESSRLVHRIADRILDSAGYRMLRIDGWGDRLAAAGFSPCTLLDIGAAWPNYELYLAFPDAYLLLVDPLPGPWADQFLARLAEHRRAGDYVDVAVGSEVGSASIYVDPDLARSSLLARTNLTRRETRLSERTVTVTNLDILVEERHLLPPFGIKIDTEGYELEVLKGAAATLRETEFILAEVSVAERFEGGYRLAELVAHLDGHGFSLYDVLDLSKVGSRLSYMDCVFVKGARSGEGPQRR